MTTVRKDHQYLYCCRFWTNKKTCCISNCTKAIPSTKGPIWLAWNV